MICLDTNIVIALLNDTSTPVRRQLTAAIQHGETLVISPIVLFELHYGAAKSANQPRAGRRIVEFLSGPVGVLEFDAEDAAVAGAIRAALERAGTPIEPYDVLIAAQARRRHALLVTGSMREFARVDGLRTTNWTVAD